MSDLRTVEIAKMSVELKQRSKLVSQGGRRGQHGHTGWGEITPRLAHGVAHSASEIVQHALSSTQRKLGIFKRKQSPWTLVAQPIGALRCCIPQAQRKLRSR